MRSIFLGTRLRTVSVALVLLLVVLAACEPAAQPITPKPTSPPPATVPAGNQPPVIVSLEDERPAVLPLGSSKITCTAYDPEADLITFTWSATGGSFSGGGPAVLWLAPKDTGSYKITVTVSDDKGGSVQRSLTIDVVTNRPPIISSLVTDPAIVSPGKTVTVICFAYDPDGDQLSYIWKASDGTIVGVGNRVVWVAPNRGGEYTISAAVIDGKGGSAGKNLSVMIEVTSPERTIVFYPLAEESGSVYWDGFVEKRTMVGDDMSNLGIRACFSFDIVPLSGKKVIDAYLTFATKQVYGNPFAGLGQLHLEQVNYGALPLSRSVFSIEGSPIVSYIQTLPVEVDVTSQVNYQAQSSKPRFQVRMRFDRWTDSNYDNNYILFSGATLTVTYIE